VPGCSQFGCVQSCKAGFSNCNFDMADGCEVYNLNDVNYCGGCGVQCTGGTSCVSGSCI